MPSAAVSCRHMLAATTTAAEAEHEQADEPQRVRVEVVLDDPHHDRREEPTETAGGTDDPGRRARRVGKLVRDELEDGAVAEPEEAGEGQAGDRDRHDRRVVRHERQRGGVDRDADQRDDQHDRGTRPCRRASRRPAGPPSRRA